ncbi:hypothetical protein C8N46_101336 [Kordia periserrulae]|uniref:Uncharacterized protein n=1 Tax=Kordia periserrulae TaxID=701523 RepID=A0A2T6C607_9FLAO|nr:hypothetical protein [Kordia periserrulae]PTX63732.1 hypothetical protein C8N46_101336 [Kordia periserrulae]
MKRKGIKKIEFKKSIVSNFTTDAIKGGTRTSNLCSVVCTGQCEPISDGCFTQDNGSACICL